MTLTKADKYMVEMIHHIQEHGYKDINPRPKYADGTPAHTISVNHTFRTYDLSKGEFPICTLRPQAWKTGIREIMAIYQNQSNNISEFERLGCGWWKDWALEDGTIGRAYPYNLESHRPNEMKKIVKKITRRIVDPSCGLPLPVKIFPEQQCENDTVYLNRYKVIGLDKEKSANSRQKYYKIQFISNNFVSSIRKDTIGKSNGINPYDRTVYNIGYLGEYKTVKNFTEDELEILKDKWENMMRRSYSKPYKESHDTYDDVFVHSEWHSFEQFLRDVREIPQYFLAREDNFKGWDLDKDYYGSNAYSKNTCVFLKHQENSLYADTSGCYEILDCETGKKFFEINISEFANTIGSKQSHVQRGISTSGKFKNFIFEFLPNTDDYVYRYELSRNQVVELIKDIQNNPYGRRHIISFWHWANIDKKSLVECAYETIWNVRGEYLDMMLVQRSGDMLTASGPGGINEVQYAALLMMIAAHTGYKPGVFTHVVANEQIYDRHFDAADEMLVRAATPWEQDTLYGIPYLYIKENVNNFYDMTIDDFVMTNYNPIKPQLRLELGI